MTVRRLDISLAIDPARARLWHRTLRDELRRRGHRVSVALKPGTPKPPVAIGLVQQFEQIAGRARAGGPSAVWTELCAESGTATPDLVIDLSGSGGEAATPTLRPVFGRALVEEAAAAALMERQVPRLGVQDTSAASSPRMTTPAIEHPHLLSRSLDNVGARMASLLAAATEDVAAGRTVAGSEAAYIADAHEWRRSLAAQAATHTARLLLGYLLKKTAHWYVGWRRTHGDSIADTLAMPAKGWARLADDGKRIYADPFVAAHEGRHWLFVEEVPYATQKGILSVVEIGPDGPIGTPQPFLEREGHLSYPFVFERDGAMWMIPESSAEAKVDLYRAESFPHRWTRVATLIDGQRVGDATVTEHDGRLWLFGTIGGDGASTWDALHIWWADRLEGPWHALGPDPVLVDAQSARPAGGFFRYQGALWRPAQDCTAGYGGALALCRVTNLGLDGFAQSVERVLRPGGPEWPGKGLHTLNWSAGIEVVDGYDER
jgi:hypothetical protein